jgi:hypothetical protein
MFVKLFGMKLRVECIVISMIIGAILGCHLVCGCATQEGMDVAGSALGYKMSQGVHMDKYESKPAMSEMNGGSRLSPTVPLPEGQLFMYANNEFSGKCCENSNVSGASGCACITKEQYDYLNSRGGNRTSGAEY